MPSTVQLEVSMIRLQIAERTGSKLFKTLVADMKSGKLRTFWVSQDKRKITHIKYKKTRMNWSEGEGVITCEIKGAERKEWDFLSALVGRLADKYADRIQNIAIQFPEA